MRIAAGWILAVTLGVTPMASAQTEITRVGALNALSTVDQRHMVRVERPDAPATLMMAVQRDAYASPDGEGLHWYRSDDEGRSWRYYAKIFEDGVSGRELHMTADVLVVGADLAVVWSYDTTQTNFPSDSSDPQRRVYFQWWRHNGSGGWTPGERLTVGSPSSGRAYHRANLARDSKGRIWVQGWYRASCSSSAGVRCADAIRLWVSTDGGQSFASQPELYEGSTISGGRVISLGSRMMMLWDDYTSDTPARFAVRSDSDPLGSWSEVQTAFSDGIYHGAAFNSVADGRGGMHLVYKDRAEQLYYRYFDGSRFGSRTFVDGDAHWTVQPAITLHGDDLYVCTNHYRSSSGTSEIQSRRLSDGFSSRVVLDGSSDKKYYPTAPERVPSNVSKIPCAYTPEGFPGRMKVVLQSAEVSEPEEEEPPPDPDLGVRAFQDGVTPAGYTGTRDGSLLAEQPSVNAGAAVTGFADGSPDAAIALSWDLRSLPTNLTVVSAAITLDVTNATSGTYELYELQRAWDERALTWTAATATANWSAAGAQGSPDRGSTVVGVLGPVATGSRKIVLNAAGIALVQRWIQQPETNFGVIVQDYAGSGDGVDISMREDTTPARRPLLELSYVVADAPPPPPLPTVSVNATGASASEGEGTRGTFTFQRTGSTTTSLTVHYELDGTATEGDDFEALSGTLELPAGATSAELRVLPLEDTLSEGAETVVLSLRAASAYTLGAPASATVVIQDDDAPDAQPQEVSFQQGVLPSSAYAGARDATLSASSATTNAGATARLEVDGLPEQSVVMAWDVSAIPPGSTVDAASITLRVENPTGDAYGGYALLRPWREAEVTWSQAMAGAPWSAPGTGDVDRAGDLLVTLTAPSTGSVTFALTAAGLATVQRWVDDPSTNHGLIFRKLPNTDDGLDVVSREGPTANRPKLTVRYRR